MSKPHHATQPCLPLAGSDFSVGTRPAGSVKYLFYGSLVGTNNERGLLFTASRLFVLFMHNKYSHVHETERKYSVTKLDEANATSLSNFLTAIARMHLQPQYANIIEHATQKLDWSQDDKTKTTEWLKLKHDDYPE